jgi:hypothetical protein
LILEPILAVWVGSAYPSPVYRFLALAESPVVLENLEFTGADGLTVSSDKAHVSGVASDVSDFERRLVHPAWFLLHVRGLGVAPLTRSNGAPFPEISTKICYHQ